MKIEYTKKQAIKAVELPRLQKIRSYGPLGRTDVYICSDKETTKKYIKKMNRHDNIEKYIFIFKP